MSVQLDGFQAQVAKAQPEARRIVSAGPGAGKTEVVGHLVEHLIADGLYPEEILVISFSRAAVDVLLRRTSGMIEQGLGIDTATIDSLAARVLTEWGDADSPFRGYDDTVGQATKVLGATDELLFGDIRHVVVDEVQDVVGMRGQFVLALLACTVAGGAGFTLLGDALQSVYDFQLDRDPFTSADLLHEIRTRYEPSEHLLTGEYRTRSKDTREAARARTELLNLGATPRLHRLTALAADVPPLGTLNEDAVGDISHWPGRTAFLCDTNIRAALLADQAGRLGLPVGILTGSSDPSLDAWVGELLQDSGTSTVSHHDFLQLAETAQLDWADERWRLLMHLTRSRRDLPLRTLGEALQPGGRREMERNPAADAAAVASTVHRAKGLEFDNVVLVDTAEWSLIEESDDAAGRRLFVALTRARSRLSRVTGITTADWRKERAPDDTAVWIRRPPRRRGRGRATEILLEPWMARALGPIPDSTTPQVGAALIWRRVEDLITVDGEAVPSWVAVVGGVTVARTGETFGHLLQRISPVAGRTAVLNGGRVEGTETVTGPARPDGVGRYGFWTGTRVTGPLTLTWNDESTPEGEDAL